MNLRAELALIERLLRENRLASKCWAELCVARDFELGEASRSRLRGLDLEEDASAVAGQLRDAIRNYPLPADVDGLWFGLFDALDEDGQESAGYYVGGMCGYDRFGHRALEGLAWRPEGRYLHSRVLHSVKEMELEARARRLRDLALTLGYTFMLGGAAFVSRSASALLGRPSVVLVGFDSGDRLRVL